MALNYVRDFIDHSVEISCDNLVDFDSCWFFLFHGNSCGHTTDFYLGKTDLPRANSSKICLVKFILGFVLPR